MLNDKENRQNDEQATNFGLPQDYFQKSLANIVNKLAWLEEHKAYPLLSQLKDAKGFVVPANYFEKAEDKLENLAYPKLLDLKKNTSGFRVPNGYFEEAEVSELARVMNEKEKVLMGIPKSQPFITPNNYFEKSAEAVFAMASPKKRTRIISLFSVRTVMAAAAVLLITLGWWGYDRFINVNTAQDCGTIACIDRIDLLNTRVIENLETEDLYELVNSNKLEEKLNKPESRETKKKDSAINLNEEAIDDLLDGI
jgi:hypothetical protein